MLNDLKFPYVLLGSMELKLFYIHLYARYSHEDSSIDRSILQDTLHQSYSMTVENASKKWSEKKLMEGDKETNDCRKCLELYSTCINNNKDNSLNNFLNRGGLCSPSRIVSVVTEVYAFFFQKLADYKVNGKGIGHLSVYGGYYSYFVKATTEMCKSIVKERLVHLDLFKDLFVCTTCKLYHQAVFEEMYTIC
eukprot:Awhi_evm1s7200